MYNPIDILPGALDDITRLSRSDPEAVVTILTFLEEAEADPALIQKFTTRGDVNLGKFLTNVKPWAAARSSGNLYRLRILDTPATSYRVVYGYDWRQRRIGILAILHKDEFDYELDSTIAQRILADWHVATEGHPT